MYDFAFDARGLERELMRSDFSENAWLTDEVARLAAVSSAVTLASDGLHGLDLMASRVKGNTLYQVMDLSQNLVLRKLARNVRFLTRVRQSDRDTVIKSLSAVLSEGHNYRAYKLDISRFYESIDRDVIESSFENDTGFPAASLFVFRAFNQQLTTQKVHGLPRGLAISATLSEYVMRRFDKVMRASKEVYFFARYVDDIVIITTGQEDRRAFLRKVRATLPAGLLLNTAKCRVADFFRPKASNLAAAKPEDVLDFLGYRFVVYGQAKSAGTVTRRVDIDIAPKKITRFKTRITLSLLQYKKDGNFLDLLNRLKLLSGNYNLYDYDKSLRRNVGISWNYRHIHAQHSNPFYS
jgi:hypothetical protein